MISNLFPKQVQRRLDPSGATKLFFADCDACFPFLTVSLKGTFEERGEMFLEFEVMIAEEILLESIIIADPIENVIDVQLNEDPRRQGSFSAEYVVKIDSGTTLPGTTMIFTATRKNKKGAWKYTKASGPIGRPRKKGEENNHGRRGIDWFRRRRSI